MVSTTSVSLPQAPAARHCSARILCRADPALRPAELSACPLTSRGMGPLSRLTGIQQQAISPGNVLMSEVQLQARISSGQPRRPGPGEERGRGGGQGALMEPY